MAILLIFMMLWCAALLWCILKETERPLQYVFTVVCLSGGILFFPWFLTANEFFSYGYSWRKHERDFVILFCLIIFLTLMYSARVLGARIDKGRKK